MFLNYSIGTIQTASVLSDEVYIEMVAVILIKVAGTCSIWILMSKIIFASNVRKRQPNCAKLAVQHHKCAVYKFSKQAAKCVFVANFERWDVNKRVFWRHVYTHTHTHTYRRTQTHNPGAYCARVNIAVIPRLSYRCPSRCFGTWFGHTACGVFCGHGEI